MKNLTLLIALIFTFGILANAQSQQPITAQVPFDFYIQNQKMTAGVYVVESISPQSAQPILIFRQKDGKGKRIVMTIPFEINGEQKLEQPTMFFNRYGDEYFLSEIRNPLEKLSFEISTANEEKSLARNFGKPTQESVGMGLVKK